MFGNSGISIGRYFGIPVRLHPSWFIILAVMTMGWTNMLVEENGISSALAFPWALGGVLLAFISLLAHEFGHALAARYFGIRTNQITLFLFGGMAEIRSEPKTPGQEFIIAAAGPVVSLVLAALFFGISTLLMSTPLPPHVGTVVSLVTIINLVFAIFNLLPGFPMDGGRMLRAVIWFLNKDLLSATRWASYGGQTIAFMIMGLGVIELFMGSFSGILVILTGFYLRWLATTSYRQTQVKTAFDAMRVRDLMRPVEAVIPAEASVAWAVRNVFNRLGGDRYPVVRGGSLLGYVTARDLATVPKSDWETTFVDRFVRNWRDRELLAPDTPALSGYQRLTDLARLVLPVFQGRELVGFLFIGDVSNYVGRYVDRTK